MTLTQVMNEPRLKMGHSFVLAMLLTREFPPDWQVDFISQLSLTLNKVEPEVLATLDRLPQIRQERAALEQARIEERLASDERKRQERAKRKEMHKS